MNYIDIHTHNYYQDPETTLVLNVFPDERDKLNFPALFSVGLHPWHAEDDTWEKNVEVVRNAATNKKVVAIGETGLDKAIKNPFSTQLQVFTAQLAIAESIKKPVIIHCVRSYSEMLAFRKQSNQSVPWIFHWFNSDHQISRELIRKNCYLSFGHMLFNEQSKAFQVFKGISLENVFFETDDVGYTIKEVYARAADIRNTTVSFLKTHILNNFRRCFQL